MITDFGGKVEIQRANRATWEAGRVGMKLYEGDFLKTGANGLAEVMSVDGTYLPDQARDALRGPPGQHGRRRRGRADPALRDQVHRRDRRREHGGGDPLPRQDRRGDRRHRGALERRRRRRRLQETGISTYQGSATLSTGRGDRVVVGERERAVAALGAGLIGPKVKLPDPPRPLVPEDSQVFDARRKAQITLRWASVPDAVKYRLQIARSRLFLPDSIIAVDDRPRPEAIVLVPGEGSFFWRVATLGRANVVSDWSPTRRFQVVSGAVQAGVPDTVPPELVVGRPQVNGTFVIVSGRAEPGSAVTSTARLPTWTPRAASGRSSR